MRDSRGNRIPTLEEICNLAMEVMQWAPTSGPGVEEGLRHFQVFFRSGYKARMSDVGSDAIAHLKNIQNHYQAALQSDPVKLLEDINKLRRIDGLEPQAHIGHVDVPSLQHRLKGGQVKRREPGCSIFSLFRGGTGTHREHSTKTTATTGAPSSARGHRHVTSMISTHEFPVEQRPVLQSIASDGISSTGIEEPRARPHAEHPYRRGSQRRTARVPTKNGTAHSTRSSMSQEESSIEVSTSHGRRPSGRLGKKPLGPGSRNAFAPGGYWGNKRIETASTAPGTARSAFARHSESPSDHKTDTSPSIDLDLVPRRSSSLPKSAQAKQVPRGKESQGKGKLPEKDRRKRYQGASRRSSVHRNSFVSTHKAASTVHRHPTSPVSKRYPSSGVQRLSRPTRTEIGASDTSTVGGASASTIRTRNWDSRDPVESYSARQRHVIPSGSGLAHAPPGPGHSQVAAPPWSRRSKAGERREFLELATLSPTTRSTSGISAGTDAAAKRDGRSPCSRSSRVAVQEDLRRIRRSDRQSRLETRTPDARPDSCVLPTVQFSTWGPDMSVYRPSADVAGPITDLSHLGQQHQHVSSASAPRSPSRSMDTTKIFARQRKGM